MRPAFETVLLALHIMAVTCWFAPKLFWPRRLRTALAAGPEAARATVQGIRREVVFVMVAGLVTIATGLGLVFLHGGFKAVPPRIHAGFGLTLVAFFGGALFSRRPFKKLAAAVDAGRLDEALPLVKAMIPGEMIEHTCWMTTLVLMVWRIPPG